MRGLPDIEKSLSMALMHVNEALAAMTTLGMETTPQKATRNSLMLQLAQIRGTQQGLRDRTAREVEAEEDAESAVDPVRVHLMVAALCALYLRDAIVLSGRDDVAGGLCLPLVRISYLERAAELAAVVDVIDDTMLSMESDDALKAVIGLPLIWDAAKAVIDVFDNHALLVPALQAIEEREVKN